MAFTFFFRDEPVLSLAIKQMVTLTMGRKNIHILDAGCAMGMETYTSAIILAENIGKFALRNVKIHAVDIDNENVDFGRTVTEGRYHKDFLQRIPDGLLQKYFIPDHDPNHYKVCEDLKSLVTFKRYDLLELKPLRHDFSLIICKNVLLHFNYQQRIEVLSMFYDTMLQDGLLAMENTQQMPVEMRHKFRRLYGYAQLYQKIEPAKS